MLVTWLLISSAIFGGGFLLNEWTHGGVSEAMGLGHHHAFDVGGYHCAPDDDKTSGALHVAHMHGDSAPSHDECAGSHGTHGPMEDGA